MKIELIKQILNNKKEQLTAAKTQAYQTGELVRYAETEAELFETEETLLKLEQIPVGA